MKAFKCTVTRTDEYVITFDESKMTPEWMAEFAQTMYRFNSLEQHAEHLAQLRARFPREVSFEGYGVATVNKELPFRADPNDAVLGIDIEIVSEDDDIDVDVEELTD